MDSVLCYLHYLLHFKSEEYIFHSSSFLNIHTPIAFACNEAQGNIFQWATLRSRDGKIDFDFFNFLGGFRRFSINIRIEVHFCCDQCPFISQCKRKKCTLILKYNMEIKSLQMETNSQKLVYDCRWVGLRDTNVILSHHYCQWRDKLRSNICRYLHREYQRRHTRHIRN